MLIRNFSQVTSTQNNNSPFNGRQAHTDYRRIVCFHSTLPRNQPPWPLAVQSADTALHAMLNYLKKLHLESTSLAVCPERIGYLAGTSSWRGVPQVSIAPRFLGNLQVYVCACLFCRLQISQTVNRENHEACYATDSSLEERHYLLRIERKSSVQYWGKIPL